MTLTATLKILAIFVPELEPLIPAITTDYAEAQKGTVIVQPVITRLNAGEDAILEEAQAYEQLQAPEYKAAIVSAFKIVQQLETIATAYGAKIEGAI